MPKTSQFLGSRARVLLLLLPALLFFSGCDDNDVMRGTGTAPYILQISLGSGYRVPHGDQPVEWALIRTADAVELARGAGTVSSIANPAYTLTVSDVLEFGVDYELRYWIDSNTGGGTAGVCDDETIDHQWNFKFRAPDNDVNLILVYVEDRLENVCPTFI